MADRGSETVSWGRSRRRLRDSGRLPWRALSRSGRISVAGVAASAVLAIALGWFIPRVAERHALEARLETTLSLVRVLEREHLVPPIGDHLSGAAYAGFDEVVRGGLLGGDNVRVKLWNTAGEIVYSDARALVGRRFSIGPHLAKALAGVPTVEVSDLSSEENSLDRSLGSRLLELYIPLRNDQGQIIGAFEVYQDFRSLAAHLAAIRSAVWIAVGSGLSILLVFLVLLFSATSRAMERDHSAAVDRAEDLSVLLRTAEILSLEQGIGNTAPQVLQLLAARLQLQYAALLVDGHEPPIFSERGGADLHAFGLLAAREAMASREQIVRQGPTDVSPGRADVRIGSWVVAVPVSVEPGPLGSLVACREAERPFGPKERALVAGVAGQLGVAAESGNLFTDLQRMTQARGELLRKLVDAQEEERRHIVGDLHDGASQTLTRVLYGLRGSRSRLIDSRSEVADELARLETLVDELISNLRRDMAAIRPAMLEDFGLVEALEAFARAQEEEAGLRIDVHAGSLPEMSRATAVTLYRAVQEAVMNARKHADASRLQIRIRHHDGSILLDVGDDGHGIQGFREGIGLTYMKDRVESLGGSVEVDSRPGTGTTVSVRVPAEDGR